jgi:hypothetical protein
LQEISNFGPIVSKSLLRLLVSAARSIGNAPIVLQWFKQRPTSLGWFEEMGKREMAIAEAEKSATVEPKITRGELLGRESPRATVQDRSEGKKVDGKHGSEEAPQPITYRPDGKGMKEESEGSGPVTYRPPETEED